jgi:hypothetical protein
MHLNEKFGSRDKIGSVYITPIYKTNDPNINSKCLLQTKSNDIICDIILGTPVNYTAEQIETDTSIIQNFVFKKNDIQPIVPMVQNDIQPLAPIVPIVPIVIYKYLGQPLMKVEVTYLNGFLGTEFGLNIILAPLINLDGVNPTNISYKQNVFPEDYVTIDPLESIILSEVDTKPAREIPISQ